jgi:hypothetical protein
VTRLNLLRRRLGFDPATGAVHYLREVGSMEITKVASIGTTPTTSASRYLQQVCKHWSHNLQVEFTAEHGTIVFPKNARGADFPGDALATFDAGEDALTIRIDASVPEQLERMKGVIAKHVDRFAFREAPMAFTWVDEE